MLEQTGSAADVPGEIERFGAARTGIGAPHNPGAFDPSQAFHQGEYFMMRIMITSPPPPPTDLSSSSSSSSTSTSTSAGGLRLVSRNPIGLGFHRRMGPGWRWVGRGGIGTGLIFRSTIVGLFLGRFLLLLLRLRLLYLRLRRGPVQDR